LAVREILAERERLGRFRTGLTKLIPPALLARLNT
jgi:hypothetical protein